MEQLDITVIEAEMRGAVALGRDIAFLAKFLGLKVAFRDDDGSHPAVGLVTGATADLTGNRFFFRLDLGVTDGDMKPIVIQKYSGKEGLYLVRNRREPISLKQVFLLD